MALNPEQVDQLLEMIRRTREVELTCPECMDEMDKYVQSVLDGVPVAGVLQLVHEHLELCPCCRAEFQLVLDTLTALED